MGQLRPVARRAGPLWSEQTSGSRAFRIRELLFIIIVIFIVSLSISLISHQILKSRCKRYLSMREA